MSSINWVTVKEFEDITYMDALPYQTFFNCNENQYTNYYSTHNYYVAQIESLKNNIKSMQKTLHNDNTTENNATQTFSHLMAATWSDTSAITSIARTSV